MIPSSGELYKADILVVDDTPANLHLLTRILREAGYHVRTMPRGALALASIEAARPDLILLDILMPDMDGYSVCDRLKASSETRDIPVIYLSAQGEIENKLRAFDTGAVDYITKPFQVQEILARIDTHLKIRDLQRQLLAQNTVLQREIEERQRAQEALARRADELTILYRSSLAITSGLELSHVLTTLHKQVQQLMPTDVAYVALYSASTGEFKVPFYFDREQGGIFTPDLSSIPATQKGMPAGFAAHVINTRKTFHVPDICAEGITLPARFLRLGGRPSRAYLGVPLLWQDDVIGVLSVQSYEPNVYTKEHVDLAEAIAVQAAIAIQNAHLYNETQLAQQRAEEANAELERMANTDKLTGVFNRHKFDEVILSEMHRARRYNTPLSLVIFDIDLFKNINDTYGHHIGDEVLKALTKLVQEKIRESDTLARWGGEEFIVLLPGNDLIHACEMAERLRSIVYCSEFSPVKQVSISLGASCLSDDDTPDSLIRRADDALYRAKRGGRNRVEAN